MALIENIQREDLNPIEEALAYRRLADEFHLTQEDIADAVGKDRASVANYVRLLQAAGRSPRRSRLGPRCRWATRARCSRCRRERRSAASRATSSRAASRCARPNRSSRKSSKRRAAREAAQPKPVDVHTRAAEDRLKLAARHARPHRPPGHSAAASRSISSSEDELHRIYEQLTDEIAIRSSRVDWSTSLETEDSMTGERDGQASDADAACAG